MTSHTILDPVLKDSTGQPVPAPKPWLLGFLCLLIPMLPPYSVFPGPLKSNGSPAKLLGMLLFFLVVLAFVVGNRRGSESRFRPAVAIFSLFFLINLLIFGVGVTHLDSAVVNAAHTRVMLSVMAVTGVGLYTVTRVRLTDRDFLLGCLAIGLTFNCIAALLFSQFAIDIRLLFQPPGFVQNRGAEQLQLAERLGVLRAQGTSSHPIEFSVLAVASVPITIYFSRFARKRDVRLLAAIATPVNILGMVAAISRTGIIALIAALLIFMWAFPLRRLAVGLAIGFATAVATVAATPKSVQALWDTVINSQTDSSVLDRLADYPKVSQTLREHPFFGLGLGGAEPSEYGFTDNQWLQQLVSGGMCGFLAISLITGAAIFGLPAALRIASGNRQRTQSYAIGASVIAILSSSFTFDLFGFQQSYFLFFLLVAMLWVDFDIETPRGAAHNDGPPRIQETSTLKDSRLAPGHAV